MSEKSKIFYPDIEKGSFQATASPQSHIRRYIIIAMVIVNLLVMSQVYLLDNCATKALIEEAKQNKELQNQYGDDSVTLIAASEVDASEVIDKWNGFKG